MGPRTATFEALLRLQSEQQHFTIHSTALYTADAQSSPASTRSRQKSHQRRFSYLTYLASLARHCTSSLLEVGPPVTTSFVTRLPPYLFLLSYQSACTPLLASSYVVRPHRRLPQRGSLRYANPYGQRIFAPSVGNMDDAAESTSSARGRILNCAMATCNCSHKSHPLGRRAVWFAVSRTCSNYAIGIH